ncbi:3-oxoacyl-ACP reductase family protein [Marinospirillum sp.]|uniref:SDR family NAD(P)-dependent oxidoreductase n=1 Tax=Marinospirillum sp. TaxID=2183934 RepID=UPI00287021D6|nr:3-oxoacyl-ACP reductase family protein [Marinospirillum sp.]MDR9468879.1 3-oxoacyl-ACP reductase family protein [Marinospirillum sp.]
MRLQGKNILVTGGASGIGLASVERCLEEGANLVIADLPSSEGDKRARELDGKHSGRCLFVPVDVTSTAEVDALLDKMQDELGSVDGLFNNAGIGNLGASTEVTDDDFHKVIDINLTGVFRVARAALRFMQKQGSGSIVNCASILGVFGQSQTAAYTAAKGGVVNMTRTLALEYATQGIRVNSIGPGYIDTPLLEALDDEMRQFLIDLHPMKRLGRPEEIANAFLFLVSDEASFVTGANLLVDGGFTAGKS